ncbi:hypothetical protein [uncultured Dokdonia sp.]|uniref:hypothetical protein n=1 Tax=uncultured Dokdonia sp. TaxID=575653 RepID=UPI0026253793|nr:hypothetical protein [uncultured Dokdonia sp.]
MKIATLLFLLILFLFGTTQTIFAQEEGIQITHHKGKRVKFVKEGKRIKVFTDSGEKYKGRYTIIDEETIQIKGQDIKLEDIYLFKKKSLFNTITKSVIFVVGTSVMIGGIASGGVFGPAIGVSFGVVTYLVGLIVPEIFVKNLDEDRWSYKIIANSN